MNRFVAGVLTCATLMGATIFCFARPSHAVTHIDTIFDCAAIEASSSNVPKFWAQAGDTVTVTFRNCYTGTANSFSIFGGNGNGMFLNYDSLTNATNTGLTNQWIVRNDAARTGDWTLSGTIQSTANNGAVTLSASFKTIGYYALPNLGGTTAWNLGGVGPTQTLTPLTQTVVATVNRPITATSAFTATNFVGTMTYTVLGTLPAGLSIDSATGIISGTPTVTQAETRYSIRASGSSASMIADVTISVSAPLPALGGGTSSVTGMAGQAITPTAPFTISDFTCTPSFGVAPALPDGLSVDTTTGVISGTPSSPSASADYTVTASCDSESATAVVNIGIASPPPSISFGVASLDLTVGTALDPTPAIAVAYFSCSPTFSVAPDLPAGLALDATTGSISGTPATAFSATEFTFTAACGSESADSTVTLSATEPTPVDDLAKGISSLVNTGLNTVGPTGLMALSLACGLAVFWFASRARLVQRVGRVIVHESDNLTILSPAKFFDTLRRRNK